jgi:hypothetical protein
MCGVHKRMGEEVRSDFALSIKVLHRILGHLDKEWHDARTVAVHQVVVEMTMFLVAGFGLGLRGEEVLKMDIASSMTYYEAGRDHSSPHVMIPLLGRFKGETGEQWHLLPVVWKTKIWNRGRHLGYSAFGVVTGTDTVLCSQIRKGSRQRR